MLTKRQRDCLLFIDRYQRLNYGDTPSFQKIADGLGINAKSGAHRIVKGLVERGFVLHEHRGTEIHLIRTVTGGKLPPDPDRIPIYRSGDHKLMGYLPWA